MLIILALASILVFLPDLINGAPNTHSSYFNIPWQREFSKELFRGNLYPRWLSDYWNGVGAPVFFFYFPLPFYFNSAIVALMGNPALTSAAISIGSIFLLFFSGISMYILLAPRTGRLTALSGSLCYLFTPYHLIDFSERGSLGEGTAYIWLPLILHFILKNNGHYKNAALAALCYAALIATHLPIAFLMIPVMGIAGIFMRDGGWHDGKWWKNALRLAVIGVWSAVLCGIYLVPALGLTYIQPHDAWVTASGSHYYPESSLLFGKTPLTKFFVKVYLSLGLETIGLVFFSVFCLIFFRKHLHEKKMLFSLLGILCICWVLMTPLGEWAWLHIKTLRQVQFAWRLGTIVELCVILAGAICLCSLREVLSRRQYIGLCVLFPVIYLGSLISIYHTYNHVLYNQWYRIDYFETQVTRPPAEYTTAAVFYSSRFKEDKHAWEYHIATLPNIFISNPDKQSSGQVQFTRSAAPGGTITAKLSRASEITLRLAHCALWQLTDEKGNIIPYSFNKDNGLLTFKLPKGQHQLQLTMPITKEEKIGIASTLLGLLILIMVVIRHLRLSAKADSNFIVS